MIIFIILIIISLLLFFCKDNFLNTTNHYNKYNEYLMKGFNETKKKLQMINNNYIKSLKYYDEKNIMYTSIKDNIQKVDNFIYIIDSLDPNMNTNDLIIQAEQICQHMIYEGPTETRITANNLRVIIDQVISTNLP